MPPFTCCPAHSTLQCSYQKGRVVLLGAVSGVLRSSLGLFGGFTVPEFGACLDNESRLVIAAQSFIEGAVLCITALS